MAGNEIHDERLSEPAAALVELAREELTCRYGAAPRGTPS
jgi:hypothetical protein